MSLCKQPTCVRHTNNISLLRSCNYSTYFPLLNVAGKHRYKKRLFLSQTGGCELRLDLPGPWLLLFFLLYKNIYPVALNTLPAHQDNSSLMQKSGGKQTAPYSEAQHFHPRQRKEFICTLFIPILSYPYLNRQTTQLHQQSARGVPIHSTGV